MSSTLRLIGYIRRLPGQYTLGVILTLFYALLFQAIPLSVRNIVSIIESNRGTLQVRYAVIQLIVLAAVFAVVRFSSRVVLFRAGREIEYQIRNEFFQHLLRQPQSFFGRNQTGDLMSRAINDINSIRLFLGMGVLNIVQTPVLYLGSIVVMVAVDPLVTFWIMLPFLLFVAITRFFGQRIFQTNLAAQEQLGMVSNSVQENASGVMVVRAYAIEEQENARFEIQNQKLFSKNLQVVKVGAWMQSVLALLPALAMMLLLFYGGRAVEEERLDSADLWVFYVYITLLAFPTILLGFVVMLVQRGFASLKRLGEILDAVPSISDNPASVSLDRIYGEVEFKDLEFFYPDRENSAALSGINLTIEACTTVGVVGMVGSGKSTLVGMIAHLFEVGDRKVLIDGVDINRIPIQQLRSSIAMVPQDSFLFSTTIADNIRFGCPDASIDRVIDAARRAQVLDDIEEFPNKFNTLVGERGITLSGGQRQRIALARALILEPSILILDDALSSVDTETEDRILRELRNAKVGRTCIIAAHRLSAVRDADQIVVLAQGKVVEQGTHLELLQNQGAYSNIYRQQQLEQELNSESTD